ncbi:hypothetical protein BT96DRAFT_925931, partial [Gymnopus androsaceus JB14]
IALYCCCRWFGVCGGFFCVGLFSLCWVALLLFAFDLWDFILHICATLAFNFLCLSYEVSLTALVFTPS